MEVCLGRIQKMEEGKRLLARGGKNFLGKEGNEEKWMRMVEKGRRRKSE